MSSVWSAERKAHHAAAMRKSGRARRLKNKGTKKAANGNGSGGVVASLRRERLTHLKTAKRIGRALALLS